MKPQFIFFQSVFSCCKLKYQNRSLAIARKVKRECFFSKSLGIWQGQVKAVELHSERSV